MEIILRILVNGGGREFSTWEVLFFLVVLIGGEFLITRWYYRRKYPHAPIINFDDPRDRFDREEYVLITKRLFSDCREIWLERLPGARSGGSVYKVRSKTKKGKLQGLRVLKLGLLKEIRQERKNYKDFVKPYLSSMAVLERWYPPAWVWWGTYGGLVYLYVGVGEVTKICQFQEFYMNASNNHDTVEGIIQGLFERLSPWLNAIEPDLRNLYEDYAFSQKRLEEIAGCARNLLPAIGNAETFEYKGQLFTNPIQFVSGEFERRRQRGFKTFAAITHGDLNGRNFIVDDKKNIWLIDFSHVSRTHILKDFCKLEAEIKFCLTGLKNEADVDMALDFERELLFKKTDNGGYAACDKLDELYADRPSPSDLRFVCAWKCVQCIRNRAAVFMGKLAEQGGSAREYYLGLLHYTLRVLCFEQLNEQSRTYALLSAALLCEALK